MKTYRLTIQILDDNPEPDQFDDADQLADYLRADVAGHRARKATNGLLSLPGVAFTLADDTAITVEEVPA